MSHLVQRAWLALVNMSPINSSNCDHSTVGRDSEVVHRISIGKSSALTLLRHRGHRASARSSGFLSSFLLTNLAFTKLLMSTHIVTQESVVIRRSDETRAICCMNNFKTPNFAITVRSHYFLNESISIFSERNLYNRTIFESHQNAFVEKIDGSGSRIKVDRPELIQFCFLVTEHSQFTIFRSSVD